MRVTSRIDLSAGSNADRTRLQARRAGRDRGNSYVSEGGEMANTTRTKTDLWTYDQAVLGVGVDKANFVGYDVEALDGSIGKVDEASYDAGSASSSSTRARGSSARRSCCRRDNRACRPRGREDPREPNEGSDQERSRVRGGHRVRLVVSRSAQLVLRGAWWWWARLGLTFCRTGTSRGPHRGASPTPNRSPASADARRRALGLDGERGLPHREGRLRTRTAAGDRHQ